MKRLIAFSTLLVAMNAHAVMTPVNSLGEWSTSSSLGLQGIIDARGNTLVSIGNDDHQIDDTSDATWSAIGDLSAGIVVEVAGYAPNNAFGIYNVLNPLERTQIFAGAAAAGASVSGIGAAYSVFGFYLENTVAGFTWFSDSSLNTGNSDHMVAYAGQGETLNLGNNPDAPAGSFAWDEDTLLLGWEDMNTGDEDYNDMVVLLRNVRGVFSVENTLTGGESVPDATSTASLLALSFLGLAFVRRRKGN